MSRALVTTKLRPPRTRPKLVGRPRLREVLSRAEGRTLTLVSAPAGFGKTTLLAEWSEQLSRDGIFVAWLSLDLSDNDPAHFLSYLLGALWEVEDGIGEAVLAALRSPQPPPVEAVAGVLVNDLADARREVAIFLDDYHLIDSEPIHGAVSFLLEHLPENVHLIVASRADPPLHLARLRARDQITELRAADLRFTIDEAAAFLGDVMGLTLSTGDVAALGEVTEGWITALQLAALSMRGREDVSGFVEAFSGSNRHVLDFLAEEVLERQPAEVREFLLQTSVLERMSAPLCDALTDREDGQEMLERLERENLFVVALDDERVWYRYHHLFADFLRGRLNVENPAVAGVLHLRASDWYERSGWLFEAVGHALSARDHERVARLVERAVGEMWSRGEVTTLLGWLEALSEEAKRHRPRLLLEHATALLWVGRLDDAEPLVREAERAVGVSGEDTQPSVNELRRRHLLGHIAAIRSWRVRLRGDWRRAIELARQALGLLSEDPALRSFVTLSLGTAYRDADDLEAASATFAQAAELGRAAGNTYVAMAAMAHHANLLIALGRLREADDVLQRALAVAAERGDASLSTVGWGPVVIGELHYEWNDLDAAEDRLAEGIELAGRTGEAGTQVRGHVALSRVKQARGDTDGALETAREAEQLARTSGPGYLIVEAAIHKARLYLATGDLAAATSEQERAAGVSGVSPSTREGERIGMVRLSIARGEPDKAMGLLADLREAAEEAGRTGSLIEILTLQALALWARRARERAVATLTEALALAEPEGYIRTFVDEGARMGDLLSATLEARQRGHLGAAGHVSTRYLAKLLAALAQEKAEPAADERLSEPLSERELEVLALIAAGRSNQEIAGKLFLSTSTVKTHINNLYRKLGTRSRTQALTRARELNLL